MKKIHRFFCDFNIDNNNVLIKDLEIINQIKNVLKLKKEENIFVLSSDLEIFCSILEINKNNLIP